MKEWMIEYSAASGKGKRLENQDNLRVGNVLTWVDTRIVLSMHMQ